MSAIDVELGGHGVWRVLCYAFLTEEAAGRAYRKVYDEWVSKRGDFSLWRTTTPNRELWTVILCGRPENVMPVDVGGFLIDLDYESAYDFAMRRARSGYDAQKENPLAEEFLTVKHYEGGARIQSDGTVEPYRL